LENDWALFHRADDASFDNSEIATIDISLLKNPERVLNHMDAVVLHCPVSLQSGIRMAKLNRCQIASVHIQMKTTHHVKYEGRDFCGGSSGGVLKYPENVRG
jgi:hypothetical protein